MLAQRDDPIIAIATAPGRGAVGMVRISGKDLQTFSRVLCGKALRAREAQLLTIKDGNGQAIDQVLGLFFPAPHSYTGEDVLELQGHGGTVVLHMLMQRCLLLASERNASGSLCLPHLRQAMPGEFTQRAYLNQKLDLAQAEAVSDLIDANTEAAVRSAGRSLQGAFSERVNALLKQLVQLRVQIEACLDFPEEDIEFMESMGVMPQLLTLKEHTQSLLDQAKQGQLLRDGLRLVIAGQPNAGKSSLLNALAGAELAIVTPIAGTTRDVLGQSIQINGVPIHVLDTAGLRPLADADEVEKIGIERAWEQIKQADMVMLLNDLSRADQHSYQQAQQQLQDAIMNCLPAGTSILHVHNKCDTVVVPIDDMSQTIAISAKTGLGLDHLRDRILQLAGWQAGSQEGVFTARGRHVLALQQVQNHLNQAAALLKTMPAPLDLLAEECRLAQMNLSTLTGAFNADDLLGEIFSNFCIGK